MAKGYLLTDDTGNTKQAMFTNNVSAIPTDAELDAIYGTPASVGAGFVSYLNDAGLGVSVYQVISDGTNWFYTLLVKAL